MPNVIQNPILPGFNPDPCIIRVGADFYIATSTFEWWPGVQIHHSRDLVNWQLLTHALTRVSQLDLVGHPDSCGIWAPALSYADGLFYLIFTNVKSKAGAFKDTPNYLVTAPAITGPWSEPVFLNSSGFDHSLFHDDDGRKWLLNMRWDARQGRNQFSGIVLQELANGKLVGPVHCIYKGTDLGATEGPHIYKRGGWYYLLTAEGGTSYGHSVTVARSRQLTGPYETDPENPMLTARDQPDLLLQKSGHGSLVETADGETYLAHLCARPLRPEKFCNLGRETALQRVAWTPDGWLRLANGEGSAKNAPAVQVPAPNLPPHPFPAEPACDGFDAPMLNRNFATLRTPADDSWLSLSARPGWLRLIGRESPSSLFRQSMVARRLQHHRARISTCMEFSPGCFQQTAGLIAYYDTKRYYYLRVSTDEGVGKNITILTRDIGKHREELPAPLPIDWDGPVHLRMEFTDAKLQFSYSRDGTDWVEIGPGLEAGKLSDDYGFLAFTGTFAGLCVNDLSGAGCHADFDHFTYEPTA
jgi:xylan 1,4-beta-xylosidase